MDDPEATRRKNIASQARGSTSGVVVTLRVHDIDTDGLQLDVVKGFLMTDSHDRNGKLRAQIGEWITDIIANLNAPG